MLRGGASILSDFKYHWWELQLECGHQVERRVRWLAPTDGRPAERGWGAMWHGPTLDREPPPPQHARCDECPAVAA